MPVSLVTGATGAIGLAIARELGRRGHDVVLAVRNEKKARAAVDEIRGATSARVRYEIVDLSSAVSIRDLAMRWRGPLDVLVNNAAETPRRRETTQEGIEVQLATNVLGYLWMADAFEPALRDAAPSRIINVASYWAGDLDVDDLAFERRSYDNDTAYRQSKQANRMLTVAQAELLLPSRIAVNVCHPGDVNSRLSRSLGFGGHETPDQAAATPVWLATSSVGLESTGKYFERSQEAPCRFGADRAAIARLVEACGRFSDDLRIRGWSG